MTIKAMAPITAKTRIKGRRNFKGEPDFGGLLAGVFGEDEGVEVGGGGGLAGGAVSVGGEMGGRELGIADWD